MRQRVHLSGLNRIGSLVNIYIYNLIIFNCCGWNMNAALHAILKLETRRTCIKYWDYRVVVCKMLFEWKLSHCLDNTWLSSGALSCPHEHARIFRRLREELTCLYSEDCDWENQSDSQRFYECLGDLHSDIVKTFNPFKSKEGEVYVSKEIEPYQDCLQSVAEVLENC
jgi:hypothetical protein